jgi:hypothetical protein
MSDLELLRATLRQLFKEIEDAAIENDVYFDAILESGSINLPDLKERVTQAQADLEKRNEVQARFSEMRQAIETAGIHAYAEDLLQNLPPSGKPN